MGPFRASEAVALTLIVFAVAMFAGVLVFGDSGGNSGETPLTAPQPTVDLTPASDTVGGPPATPAVAGASEPPDDGGASAPGDQPSDSDGGAGDEAGSDGGDTADSARDATPTPPAGGADQTVPK